MLKFFGGPKKQDARKVTPVISACESQALPEDGVYEATGPPPARATPLIRSNLANNGCNINGQGNISGSSNSLGSDCSDKDIVENTNEQACRDDYGQQEMRKSSKQSCNRMQTGQQVRSAGQNMAEHLSSDLAFQSFKCGVVVSRKNIKHNLLVVRGPAWKYGDYEDGGPGKPGIIYNYDEQNETAVVYWYGTGAKYNHYRIGRSSFDLCEARPEGCEDGDVVHSAVNTAAASIRNFFGRMSSPTPRGSNAGPGGVMPAMPGGGALLPAGAMAGGRNAGECASPGSGSPSPRARRNSQRRFSDKSQTAIIFDWDDTLFPRTYVKDDLGLSLRVHLQDQALPENEKIKVRKALATCAAATERVLRNAAKFGKVILVTLAREPWVTDSCRNFYPGIGELITNLGLEVVYAQQGVQVDYNKVNMMEDDARESYWSNMKGRAIGKVLESFYSQYEGQSWKNIISIGDSDFERRGTISVTQNYARALGLLDQTISGPPPPPPMPTKASIAPMSPKSPAKWGDDVQRHGSMSVTHYNSTASITSTCSVAGTVNNHDYKIRTKTFKMLDEPSVQELTVQLGLVQKWLPLMVNLDDGFDVDLNTLDDIGLIQAIEARLRGEVPY